MKAGDEIRTRDIRHGSRGPLVGHLIETPFRGSYAG